MNLPLLRDDLKKADKEITRSVSVKANLYKIKLPYRKWLYRKWLTNGSS